MSQTVYKTKGEYLKSEFYDRITGGFVSVFNTRDVDVHRRYRRLLSAGMTESNMLALYPIIDGKVRLAIQRMGEEMETRGAAVGSLSARRRLHAVDAGSSETDVWAGRVPLVPLHGHRRNR